jgi:hypothetical protein
MARPTLESLVPVPLVVTVLLMLVTLVFLKVRAARAARGGRARSGGVAAPGRTPRDLPADPVDALAALKAGRSGDG